ncbi:MAG TPA: XrtA system polysaccharide deacetylase [Gemmatimonadales bacterium]|nr:XrtA system polysaccharide deacetylase [Gemmatimonadales bacterium]
MEHPGRSVEHLFSVDVEEHFQVVALQPWAPRESWDRHPSRVAANVDRLLELLARRGAVGTFFTLGWVADRHPEVVRRIAAAGHEVASHGWWHTQVTRLTPDQFRTEVRDSKRILEQVSGRPVVGFRAPSFSIVPGYDWAFDVLLEEGYRYDSSLFPIRRPDYGWPGAPAVPHLIRRPSGTLLEIPMATTLMGGARIPAAGGGYFRQLPYALTARAFREHSARNEAGMFYIHPWEVDPGQPRLPAGLLTRLRHYGGLNRTLPRLERLLTDFSFTSVARHFSRFPGLLLEAGLPALPA